MAFLSFDVDFRHFGPDPPAGKSSRTFTDGAAGFLRGVPLGYLRMWERDD